MDDNVVKDFIEDLTSKMGVEPFEIGKAVERNFWDLFDTKEEGDSKDNRQDVGS